jgi:toxin secretion/phage lysis holin
MVLDLTSGLIAGYRDRALESHVGIAGWRKKAMTLLVVAAVAVGQGSLPVGLPAVQVIAGGFAALEFLSIIENAGRAGVRFPRVVRDYLVKLREQQAEPVPVPIAELRKRVTPEAGGGKR